MNYSQARRVPLTFVEKLLLILSVSFAFFLAFPAPRFDLNRDLDLDRSPELARGTLPLAAAVAVELAETGRPVLAAGGVVSGRGLLAALALGCDGVVMGTRCVLSTVLFTVLCTVPLSAWWSWGRGGGSVDQEGSLFSAVRWLMVLLLLSLVVVV